MTILSEEMADIVNAWTAEKVRKAVAPEAERLFAPWKAGRQPGWTCDTRTKDMVVLCFWLREELSRPELHLSEPHRTAQEWFFDRKSRAEDDLFALAAVTLNNAAVGKIDEYQGR